MDSGSLRLRAVLIPSQGSCLSRYTYSRYLDMDDSSDDEEEWKMPLDLVRYRSRYNGKPPNNSILTSNVDFYQGRIKSVPDGDFIENIHRNWATNYNRLETHHGYIQWLFPIHEEGMNGSAQVLQLHEAETIRESEEMIGRVLASYKLILGFYGLRLENAESGELARAANYKQRFSNLNLRSHNYLRITRILKFLGEVGMEKLKLAFLTFFIREVFHNGEIPNCRKSLKNYWIFTLREDKDLRACVNYLRQPTESAPRSILLDDGGSFQRHSSRTAISQRSDCNNAKTMKCEAEQAGDAWKKTHPDVPAKKGSSNDGEPLPAKTMDKQVEGSKKRTKEEMDLEPSREETAAKPPFERLHTSSNAETVVESAAEGDGDRNFASDNNAPTTVASKSAGTQEGVGGPDEVMQDQAGSRESPKTRLKAKSARVRDGGEAKKDVETVGSKASILEERGQRQATLDGSVWRYDDDKGVALTRQLRPRSWTPKL